ncbi:MAG: PKD domain-containing protein, partial [Bacteroidales bacterium]|nr:PKD domain-containing protein [Bacteroidales bacterium]
MLSRFRYILILCIALLGGLRAAAQIAMPDTVCIGATKHYWVNGSAGSTYTWAINGIPVSGSTNEIYQSWLVVGNYTLTVQETSSTGCIGPVMSGEIIVNPTSSSNSTITACDSYFWNGTTYNTSGNYSFTMPGSSQYGCDSTAYLSLTVNPLVTPTFPGIGPLCQFSTAPFLPTNSNEGIPGTWTPSFVNTSLPGIASYTFTPDPGECAVPSIMNIMINEQPVLSIGSVLNVTCYGGSNGSATVQILGGLGPYTILWDDPALQTTVTASALTAGTYTVLVTDANGCSVAETVTITQPAILNALYTTQNIGCFGATTGGISISNPTGGSGSYEYSIDGINWSSSGTFANLPPGTYTVLIRDANDISCQINLGTSVINQPAAPLSATASIIPESCPSSSDGAIDLTISGGTAPYTILWNTLAVTEDISGLPGGTYSVSIDDANGCNYFNSFLVNTIPDITPPLVVCPPALTLNTNANCEIIIPDFIGLATASDNCGTVTLLQSPVAGTVIPGAIANQIITVTILASDPSGNTSTCSTNITVANHLPVAVNDIASTNEDTPILIPVLPNDNFGCDGPSSSAITISGPASNGTATVNNGGTPLNPTDDQVLYTPNPNYFGTDSFTYTICDSNGDCVTATVNITIIATNDPPVTFNESITLCEGSSFAGNVFNGDFDPDGTVLFSNAILVSPPANGTFIINAAGNYTYTSFAGYFGPEQVIVSICDNGIPGVECTNDTIFISIDAFTAAQAGADQALCEVSSTLLNGNTPVAGNGVWSFVSGPSVPVLTPVSATSVNASGLVTSLTPYVFAYTITNGTCTTSDQVNVFNYAQPTTSFAGVDQAICTLTPAIATMAANTPLIGTGLWTQLTGPSIATINNVNNPNTTISGLIEGTYMFDWTISNGVCNPSSSAVSITISEPAVIFAGPDATICETQGSYLIGSSSEIHTQSFIWSSSGTGSFDNASLLHPTYTPSAADIAAGSVILTLSANGHFPCPDVSDAMTLTISHQASASAGPDAIICETAGSFALTNAIATQFTSVLWNSSGTGSFSNVNAVQPVYTPSAADIASGFVLLSITANSAAPCITVYDTMRLDITRQALAFAGNNDLICETQGTYNLTASTASFYSSLLWTTSGDGSFNNASLLNPVYTPGANDIANGTATLTLTAYALAPCADAVSSMVLNISRQATAFAGPDFNICETQSTVSLAGAVANYYTSLNWTTSGDGTFSNSSAVNPDYFPGPNDIISGNVTLTLTTGSAAPCVTVSDALNILITRTVTADAGPDDDACQGVPYTINGSSAAFFSNITWSHTGLGVLTAANSLHPTYVPSTIESGTITFTFRAYSNAPCTDSIVDIMTLNVHPLPTATISGGTSICEGDTAMLRIDFTGIAPWTVTYTNGIAATTVSGIMTSPYLFSVIAPVGNINYTLSALSDANCTATSAQLYGSALVIVNPTPVTDFTASSSCVNDTTFFVPSGAYLYKINHWTWNFGDGTYGVFNTPVSPTHIYPASGIYNVTLSVEDTVGCVYTISHPVTVRPLPTAYFNFSSPNCVGSATSFTDLSNNGTNQGFIQEWSWNFGDGTAIQTIQFPNTPNITHTFNLPGVYTVTLTVTNSNGCSSSYSNTVVVTPLPEAAFSFNTNCEGEVTQFIDESTTNGTGQVNTWSWNFGDLLSGSSNVSNQQNPVHTYATAGNYLVTLVVSNFNGCIDSVQNMVTINPAPVAAFTSSSGCVGTPTSFWADTTIININTIATYAWDFGDGTTGFNRNAQHTYAAPGTYTVTLTITDLQGCSGSVSHTVTVTTPPSANFFSNANSCNGLPVSFTDQSTASNGYITEWLWNFGDGTTQNILFPAIPNTSHTYALPGTYNVTLTVTNNLGCINTISHTIQVSGGPTANFYSNGNCMESPVSFNDISTVTGMMSVASWNWNFGDPGSGVSNTSNLQNPSHTFAAAGTYSVKLLITTNSGCVDSVTRQIIVKPLPLVGFTAIGSCKGGPATFTPDPSVMNIFAVTSWNWSFGDGGSSTIQAPTHTYTSAGTFTVSLTVTDTTGCSNSISHPVTIGEAPIVEFSNSSPSCSGSDVLFADQTILNSGYIVRWNWNFGDGNSQTIYFPASAATAHQYLQSGNFNVVLTVYTSDSCSAQLSRTITIGSAPNAAFTSSGSCQGTAVEFLDASSVAGSQITGRNWNFGDPASGSANSSTLQNPSHVYSTAGTYTVQLIVTSASGCNDTVTNSVTVGLPPTVDFSATSGCNGDTTQFISSSFVNMSTTQSWLWQFGDGQTSTLPDPIHIYAIAGTYSVTLTIISNGGCTASKTSQVTVNSGPLANFSAGTPTCNLSPVTFTDLTNTNGNTITSWTWLFGDGNQMTYTSYTSSLQHTYTQAGNFIVKLTVHTQNGCENSFQKSVTISAAPVADFSYQNNCEGETTAFTDLT